MYRSIYQSSEGLYEEKKSRFIANLFFIEDEEAAHEALATVKRAHPQARHHCSAYIIGEAKLIQRYSDDGEPSGTAGIPILEVLKKEDLTNILCVVTRYFGGTLLGAGGLVRAYTKATTDALSNSVIVTMTPMDCVKLTFDYSMQGTIMYYLNQNGYQVLREDYSDIVSLILHAKEGSGKLTEDILELTSAKGTLEVLGCDVLPVKDGKIIYERKTGN
ncbi:YigZ family protein [Peptoniphilus equinus]|uniref:YigZ family protein n=1 Tax=Peptoniphilus equinus TaxID=3016343 RepID=A0ABY7QR76_9FIRM|nr:YigZ family protein [Peptoniphilus equinus]WBW49292.1 YigZ family protein [Peptoniphilus equinus]